MRKIGLFGGSFDPIHNAHIEVAKIALKQLALDEIQLIPTLNNPWKDKNCVSAHDRINMIQLAISDQSSITINTIELESQSQEKNYTIDTIIKLKKSIQIMSIFILWEWIKLMHFINGRKLKRLVKWFN